MNCHEFLDQLPELLDGDSSPIDASQVAHMAECRSCREALEEMQVLGEALRGWRNASSFPPVDLRSRVISAWQNGKFASEDSIPAKPLHGTSRQRRRKFAGIAAAVLLLIGGGIVLQSYSRNATTPQNPTTISAVSNHPPTVEPLPSKTNPAPNVASRAPVAPDATALFRETATALRGAADALLPINTAVASAPPKATVTKAADGTDRRDGESDSLAQELRDTLDDLWLGTEPSDSQT